VEVSLYIGPLQSKLLNLYNCFYLICCLSCLLFVRSLDLSFVFCSISHSRQVSFSHFCFLFCPIAGIISFLKQVRNETASAISSNNNIDKHSSQDSQKQVNGISNGIH